MSRYTQPNISRTKTLEPTILTPSNNSGFSQQNQVYIVQAPRLRRTYDRYRSSLTVISGVVQFFCGLVSIMLGIANPLLCGLFGQVGYGIWCGIIFMISGCFSIWAAHRRTTCLIVASMVLNIIAACCAGIQFSLGIASAHIDKVLLDQNTSKYRQCSYEVATNKAGQIDWVGTVVTDALLAALAILEGIYAILSSAASCIVICGSQDFATASDAKISRNKVLPAQFIFSSQHPPFYMGGQTIIGGSTRT